MKFKTCKHIWSVIGSTGSAGFHMRPWNAGHEIWTHPPPPLKKNLQPLTPPKESQLIQLLQPRVSCLHPLPAVSLMIYLMRHLGGLSLTLRQYELTGGERQVWDGEEGRGGGRRHINFPTCPSIAVWLSRRSFMKFHQPPLEVFWPVSSTNPQREIKPERDVEPRRRGYPWNQPIFEIHKRPRTWKDKPESINHISASSFCIMSWQIS